MKYTKEYVANLDEKTLDFAKNWLFDTWKRQELSTRFVPAKTKAKREYDAAFGDGLKFGLEMLKKLQEYNNGGENIADEVEVFTE